MAKAARDTIVILDSATKQKRATAKISKALETLTSEEKTYVLAKALEEMGLVHFAMSLVVAYKEVAGKIEA